MLSPALASPFAMLLNPEGVIQAMTRSERLNHLRSRVYRPLDKPLIPKGLAVDLAEFDHLVDEALELQEAGVDEPDLLAALGEDGVTLVPLIC